MNDIGVAVVGAGYWGANLIRIFASLPGARLVAVCDLDAARLENVARTYRGVRCTRSLADVLEDRGVAAVVVATPAEAHQDVSLAILGVGKDLFVEKPLATSRDDAGRIVEAATAGGRVLMVGHLFMFDPAVRTAVDLVRRGTVGEVRYVTSVRTSMGGTARLDTNIVWDALIHDAYIQPALHGRPPRRVQANGRGYLSELEDVVFAVFDFGDGLLAHCYVSWYALEKARRMTVVGSEGILHLDEFATPKLVHFRRRYVRGEFQDPQGRPRWQWLDEGGEPQAVESGEPLRRECAHFVDCVRTRATPATDGAAALLAVEIIEAFQASVRSDGAWRPVGGAGA